MVTLRHMPTRLKSGAGRIRTLLLLVAILIASTYTAASVQPIQAAEQVSTTSSGVPGTDLSLISEEEVALQATSGRFFYVSRRGSNADGRSWATAWNELDRINWSAIRPGDTIMLDGGDPGMVYRTTLRVGVSGTADLPIRILRSGTTGRSGTVMIDGGLKFWPCQATSPSPYTSRTPAGTRPYGIDFNGQSWITIDGGRWNGIEVRNHTESGVRVRGQHLRVVRMNIHHNTYPDTPDGPGIDLSGNAIELAYLNIHNNGQDAIQGGDVQNLVLRDSYLHDQYCNHPDGIQLYKGTNRNIKIVRNRFERGFMQPIFLGEVNPRLNSTTNDVTIAYNVIMHSEYGVVSNHPENRNWRVLNNTIAKIEKNGIHLYNSGGGMEVRNNILAYAGYVMRNGTQSHNLYFNVPYAPTDNGSFYADPLFVDLGAGNVRLRAGSPAINAGISVGQQIDKAELAVPNGSTVDIGAFEYR